VSVLQQAEDLHRLPRVCSLKMTDVGCVIVTLIHVERELLVSALVQMLLSAHTAASCKCVCVSVCVRASVRPVSATNTNSQQAHVTSTVGVILKEKKKTKLRGPIPRAKYTD
jgi:hypothetical protein